MLIIDTRDSDSIDKALRKYKKKLEKSGVLKELRKRKQFDKPSVVNREKRTVSFLFSLLNHLLNKVMKK